MSVIEDSVLKLCKSENKWVLCLDGDYEEMAKSLAIHEIVAMTLDKESAFNSSSLWAARNVRAVLICEDYDPKELYRLLQLSATHVIVNEGIVLLLSQGSSVKDRKRFEVVELFLGIHPEFEQIKLSNNIVIKRKAEVHENV